ncbi:fimbrial assembly protein [Actinotalea sp.]|uniref:fimbrial assembly protein n=1 Tax=Actinotalea sp. TaxID=1872145 RepID=UPI0035639BB0
MTATAEAPSTTRRGRTGKGSVPVSPWPQVNLLPPEVRASRAVRVVKRWLAVVVVIAIVIAAGVVAASVLAQRGADQELADAQVRTEQLNAEKEKYAEVPIVLAAIDDTTRARVLGTSTEVLWTPYLRAVAATTPEGVSIDTFSVSAPWPRPDLSMAQNPLAADSVGTISFTARSLTVPDSAAWLDGLVTVPGFSDPWLSGATWTEPTPEGMPGYYAVTGTVEVTEGAWAQRFVDETEEN